MHSDDKIVDYWNKVDSELELDLDVLDDFCSEAAEVQKVNPWLTYGYNLHQLREFGLPLKEFDLLDEALLSTDQLRNIISMIVGTPLPSPSSSWVEFSYAAIHQANMLPCVWYKTLNIIYK